MRRRKPDHFYIPKYRYKRFDDITPEDIRKMGGRAIGLDIDNTIAPDGTYKYLSGVPEWLQKMHEAGIPVIIISNGSVFRVAIIAKHFGLPFIHSAGKPSPKGLIRAAKKLGISVSDLVMVGDQLFSDIVSANSCGAIAVRVDSIEKGSLYPWFYKYQWKKEEPYLKMFEEKHGYGYYEDK